MEDNNLTQEQYFEKFQAINQVFEPVKNRFRADIEAPQLFETHKNMVLKHAMLNANKYGNEWYIESDGKSQKLEDFFKMKFKDVLQNGTPSGGTGSGNNTPAQPNTNNDFSHCKTLQQLQHEMRGAGLVVGTKEFHEVYAKYRGKLPVIPVRGQY